MEGDNDVAYSDEELLEIRDETGTPTGLIKPRGLVHRDGDLHGCSHIFVVRAGENDNTLVLFQRRSYTKDSFPGKLDTSSAGHLAVGDTYETGAYRELKEELGVDKKDLTGQELHFLFYYRQNYVEEFYGKPFHDNEINAVFLAEVDWPAEKFRFEKEEIENVEWLDAKEVLDRLAKDDKDFCVSKREYRQLYPYIEHYFSERS